MSCSSAVEGRGPGGWKSTVSKWYHRYVKPQALNKVVSRTAAIRWRHPSRNVRLVLVGGDYGKTTTVQLLAGILREAHVPIAVFTNQGSVTPDGTYEPAYDSGAGAVQQAIARSRKAGASIVIMEVTKPFLQSGVLDHLQCELMLITDDSEVSHTLLTTPSASVVVPHYVSTESYSIAAHQMLTYGDDPLAEAHIASYKLYRKGTEVDLVIDHQTNLPLATHLIGQANIYNVAAAAAGAYMLTVDTSLFADGIARLESVAGNMEYVEHEAPYSIVLDRALSERSVELVSQSARHIAKRRLLIACDTTVPHAALQPLGKLADRVTVVQGEETEGRYHAETVDDAIAVTLRGAKKDDLVLLLGGDFPPSIHSHLK